MNDTRRRPVAAIDVLAGPTHTIVLPDAGKQGFVPGHRVYIYTSPDFEYATRVLPSAQLRVRQFPALEDATPAEPPVATVSRKKPR